jgi:hypothetical protein
MSLNPNLAGECPPQKFGDRTAQEPEKSNHLSKRNLFLEFSTLKHVKDKQQKREEGGLS